ncbi:hypothetical protein BDY19DRAFT_890032 [Irpex rosettiformis]|uniref:Uncharacterized protein n=1 Tax=Irpex rosettiformis TaxID=378272 RepID=A0ACB8U436_9APHY|nr:hypothetical protein BDY19DRAFT_890032 [Irpex rosettiformis]
MERNRYLSEVVQQVLRGEREYVASHVGRSQYSMGGMSACGLAALNCARVVLHREKVEGDRTLLLRRIMRRDTCEEILNICLQWSSIVHLEVDDIYHTPLFEKTLTLVWSEVGRLGLTQIRGLLHRTQQTSTASAIVITRPPEIITVLKLNAPDNASTIFVSFDSHPRHKHPQGAAFIFHPSLEAAALYLSELLQFDWSLLSDPSIQWQVQLLAQYSAHMFIAKDIHQCDREPSCFNVVEAYLKPSLDILVLKAELTDLREKNRVLDEEANDLRRDNRLYRDQVEDYKDAVSYLKRRVSSMVNNSKSMTVPVDSAETRSAGPPPGKRLVCRFTDEVDDENEMFATMLKFEWEDVSREASPSPENENEALAIQEQQRFEEEDRQLRTQMEELRVYESKTFVCGICLERLVEDSVARLDGCGHPFCSTLIPCVLQYLNTKLADRRWPIICPVCSTEADREEPGLIDGQFAQQLGLDEQNYAILTHLELAPFSVQVDCRGCGKAIYVDRAGYEEQNVIACPLPGCTYAWCKACSRSIDFSGPPHSCDGTSELNHLMDQQGWKNCPGCGAHTSKVDGCNHMACVTPSCNTHFCYLCGASIVRSVRRQEIRNALGAHYAGCRMFDAPLD